MRVRELYSLYVLAVHHGSGMGLSLLDAVLLTLRTSLSTVSLSL